MLSWLTRTQLLPLRCARLLAKVLLPAGMHAQQRTTRYPAVNVRVPLCGSALAGGFGGYPFLVGTSFG
jgi:hypothetical protein